MSSEEVRGGNDPYQEFIAALEQRYAQDAEQLDAERRRDAYRAAHARPSPSAVSAIAELRSTFPKNTERAWNSRLAWLEDWSQRTDRELVPATIDTLVHVVKEHARLGLSPATCNLALWVLRMYNEHSGCAISSGGRYVKLAKHLHMKIWKQHGNSVRRSVPACDAELTSMLAVTQDSGTTASMLRNRVLLIIGQKAMARRTELAALDVEDIEFTPEGMKVHVRRTVTDPDGSQAPVVLTRHDNPGVCPVKAVQEWLECMAEQAIHSGPLFRMVDRHGSIRGGDRRCAGNPNDPVRLDDMYIYEIFKMHARAAVANKTMHPGLWTSRSLRSGGAIENVRSGGMSKEDVAFMGGWDPDGPYFRAYQAYGAGRREALLPDAP